MVHTYGCTRCGDEVKDECLALNKAFKPFLLRTRDTGREQKECKSLKTGKRTSKGHFLDGEDIVTTNHFLTAAVDTCTGSIKTHTQKNHTGPHWQAGMDGRGIQGALSLPAELFGLTDSERREGNHCLQLCTHWWPPPPKHPAKNSHPLVTQMTTLVKLNESQNKTVK